MPGRPRCITGEEIQRGDRVLLDGRYSGFVGLVLFDLDPSWNFGESVEVVLNTLELGPCSTGSIEKLKFIARAEQGRQLQSIFVEVPMSTHTASAPYVEPWLRGTYDDVPAVARAVLHAFDLAVDDLTKWTEGLTDVEIHTLPLELPPV